MTLKWTKLVIASVAVVLWGLFFDDLARVGEWVVASSYSSVGHLPLADLEGRYADAHIALTHGNLYAIRRSQTFTYPPITAYLFVPFRLIGLRATMTLWTVGNVIALAIAFAISLHRWCRMSAADAWFVSAVCLAPAAIFVFYPYRSLILWGQMGVFLMLLVILDLFVVPKRYRGILIGVATAIKLLPAVFIVWFLVRRDFSAAAKVVLSFLTLTLVAAALWPHASAEYWFHVLPSGRVGRVVYEAPSMWQRGIGRLPDQSIRGLLGRPPFISTGLFSWAVLAAIVLGVGIAVTVKLLEEDRDLTAFVLLSVVTELVSPVSWPHYWVFVGLVPILAIVEWRRDRPLAMTAILLAACTCVNVDDRTLVIAPVTMMSPVVLFIVRNIYVLGGLAFLAVAAQRTFRRSTSTAVTAASAVEAETVAEAVPLPSPHAQSG